MRIISIPKPLYPPNNPLTSGVRNEEKQVRAVSINRSQIIPESKNPASEQARKSSGRTGEDALVGEEVSPATGDQSCPPVAVISPCKSRNKVEMCNPVYREVN